MSNSVSETSLSGDIFRYVRYQLRGRRGLIVAVAALGIPGLWFGWPWLVVAGVAPLLIALAPCAIMCGLGLCAMKSCSSSNSGAAGSCSKSQSADSTAATEGGTANQISGRLAALEPPQARPNSVEKTE